jgi:hypothetical protein
VAALCRSIPTAKSDASPPFEPIGLGALQDIAIFLTTHGAAQQIAPRIWAKKQESDVTENKAGQRGSENKDRLNTTSNAFRLKYIKERLVELDAERDRLVSERRNIRALQGGNNKKLDETKD